MFTPTDIEQIIEKGLTTEQVAKQIERLKNGFPFLEITAPAIPNKGILQIEAKEIPKYIKIFDKKIKNKSIIKFVPASGAASRMFKRAFAFYDSYNNTAEAETAYNKDDSFYGLKNFIENIEKFAFYPKLTEHLKNDGFELSDLIAKKEYKTILEYLLIKGLKYGNIPKGLIQFHQYNSNSRTAVEEQLVEGAKYARDSKNDVHIHFTVSPEFLDDFKNHIDEVKRMYQTAFEIKYWISYSVQKEYTDTIAVDTQNNPFKTEDDTLLFRPGGHGALIENLNDLEQDIIFIKNIDNVAPDRLKKATYNYKKVLGGILLQYQSTIHKTLQKLDNTKRITNRRIGNIKDLIEDELQFSLPPDFNDWRKDQQYDYLIEILNRPIRVCGMVKNEGEPGGGPFFVKETDGALSLQIIESAQINMNDENQKEILKNSTHFNPVDLVCGVTDFTGKKFNLLNFVDENSGIIAHKSSFGRELKALELPGLWNGAMANWNTIFVEVPIETFTPVKELNDLLRTEHQEII